MSSVSTVLCTWWEGACPQGGISRVTTMEAEPMVGARFQPCDSDLIRRWS
jgi:hypothetical protein